MRLVIAGCSNSGKTTVFNALAGLDLETTVYPTAASADIEPHYGVVKVPDKRVDTLSAIYKPKKTNYAAVEYVDYLGITSASSGGDASQNARVFSLIKDADAIVHIIRAFENDSIIHPLGKTNPVRDAAFLESELILGDLEFVEKRLERIEEQSKKGRKPDERDRALLLTCKAALEDEVSLKDVEFSEEERRLLLTYQFLSTQPEIVVLNVHENDLGSDRLLSLQQEIENYYKGKGRGTVPPVIPLCGKIEMEISRLSGEEAGAFLEDLGIEEPAMHKLCRISYDALGLISFLTVGKDEVRAWTVHRGTAAREAAGKIHSDIERGFIRAEVVSYDDFIAAGEDMTRAKEKGLSRLEGKNYTIQDGDIINFKFNV